MTTGHLHTTTMMMMAAWLEYIDKCTFADTYLFMYESWRYMASFGMHILYKSKDHDMCFHYYYATFTTCKLYTQASDNRKNMARRVK